MKLEPLDPSEKMRRDLQQDINSQMSDRHALERDHGEIWNTEELGKVYEVRAFSAPFVIVTRKSDGKSGSLMFQHNPRYYFRFEPE